jgi:hypothetical protein
MTIDSTGLVTILNSSNIPAAANNSYQYGGLPAIFSAGGSGWSWFFANSGNFTQTGAGNIGIAPFSLMSVAAGQFNTVVGYNAGCGITTASFNTAVGCTSLNGATGDGNTAVGYQSGMLVTTGTNNTFLRDSAGSGITTGSNNICIGNLADASADGNLNICIGYQANLGGTAASNYLNIGNVIKGDMATPGSITVSADPVVPLGIATKQYVDAAAGGAPGAPVDSIQFNSAGVFGRAQYSRGSE